MKCPNCKGKTKVEESRGTPDIFYRVRKCVECGWRVTTEERFADNQSIPQSIRKPKSIGKPIPKPNKLASPTDKYDSYIAQCMAHQDRLNHEKVKSESGLKGVSPIGLGGAWRAIFENKYLGVFYKEKDAHNAYCLEANKVALKNADACWLKL